MPRPRFLQQFRRNDDAADFPRAGANLGHLGVAVVAIHLGVPHETHAAVNLYGGIDCQHVHTAGFEQRRGAQLVQLAAATAALLQRVAGQ